MENKIYDTIVIGGGPAGYTAALYAARAGLSTLVLEKFSAGGQMTETSVIDNYPGFDEGIDGFSLGDKMKKGAEKYGAETLQTEVTAVSLKDKIKTVTTDLGEFKGKTVIIATGASHRHLGIENETALIGRGVGYCAVCDGMLYRRKTVAVVGGGNSAAADAAYLSRICEKVYLIHRRDSLRATKIYHEPLMKTENVEFLWDSTVEELLFDKKLTGAKMTDKVYTRYTGFPGGQRFATPADFLTTDKKPQFVIEHAVRGMLPKTRLGEAIIKNLKVYAGAEHPHAAQNPKQIKLNEIK